MDLPIARSIERNPAQDELRAWALALTPRVTKTEFGNLNYTALVTARLAPSTFFVSDTEEFKSSIDTGEAAEWAANQDRYIADQEMILIEGYIGAESDVRVGARLYIEKTQANIAAMQQQLFFPPDGDWEPRFTTIYTPGLTAPGKPNDRLISVDLSAGVTRVFGPDYFGESKMGGLRMWNHHVYELGGLACHAGLKTFPPEHTRSGSEESALIIGLSGTGKTTTTFRKQLASLPVQDDFVALMPGGRVFSSEAGCFAKTFGLNPIDEPDIYHGTTHPGGWLENVAVAGDGSVDFFDASHTANGRSTFPLEYIAHRNPTGLPPASYLFILNRNDDIVPVVARLERDQIATYFMLGETRGTSAGGVAEQDKSLRIPGTNPFFFTNDALQGNRLMELLDSMPHLEAFVLNTGRVGGGENVTGSKNIEISHSSAVVAGIVGGTIEWVLDREFGYEVAAAVPGIDDEELLQPSKLYQRLDRMDEYESVAARLQHDRRVYLEGFPTLDRRVVRL